MLRGRRGGCGSQGTHPPYTGIGIVDACRYKYRRERVRTVCSNAPLEIGNLSERRVLAAGAEEVAECAALDAPVASLVEELEGFAVVCRGLVVHVCLVWGLCVIWGLGSARCRYGKGEREVRASVSNVG
jgi:hypothetical protein